jgi:hypothetical protein
MVSRQNKLPWSSPKANGNTVHFQVSGGLFDMNSRNNSDLLTHLVRGHNASRMRGYKTSALLAELDVVVRAQTDIGGRADADTAAWLISGYRRLDEQAALPNQHWDRAFTGADDLFLCLHACRNLFAAAQNELESARDVEREIYAQYFEARCNGDFRRRHYAALRKLLARRQWKSDATKLEALALIFSTNTDTLLLGHSNLIHPKLRIAATAAIYHAIETA